MFGYSVRENVFEHWLVRLLSRQVCIALVTTARLELRSYALRTTHVTSLTRTGGPPTD